MDWNTTPSPKRPWSLSVVSPRAVAISLGCVLVAACILSTGYEVQPNQRAVITNAGAYAGIADPGFHLKWPFFGAAHYFPTDTQQFETPMLNTYTIDNQEIDAVLTVQYQVPVDEVGYLFVHNQGYEQNLRSMVINEWKIAAGTVNVSDVAEKRGALVSRVDAVVKERARALYHLDVTDVQLTNLDYAQSFRDAQAQAAVVKTQIEQAQGLQRKAQIEADTARITASGQANQAIEQARGLAESTHLQADATSYATQKNGEAQATATRLLAAAVASDAALADYTRAQRWDGRLPSSIYAGAPIPFLQTGH